MSNSSPANSREDVQVTPIPAAPRRDVADTVALILRLEKRTMGMAAQQAFQTVEAGQDQLLVPAMVCSEIMYLAERKRIAATLGDVERYVATYPTCQEAPLTLAIVKAAQAITDLPASSRKGSQIGSLTRLFLTPSGKMVDENSASQSELSIVVDVGLATDPEVIWRKLPVRLRHHTWCAEHKHC